MEPEFCHFKIPVSSVSRLLGLFGAEAQLHELFSLVRKSPHRTLVSSIPGNARYAKEQEYLHKSGTAEAWTAVKQSAESCIVVEQLDFVNELAKKTLLDTHYFKSFVAHIKSRLDVAFFGKEVAPLINRVAAGDEAALHELRKVKTTHHLDSLNPLLETSDVIFSLLAFAARIARTRYGTVGEEMYITAFNAVMQPKGQVLSRQKPVFAVCGVTPQSGYNWCLHGFIDGMVGNRLFEIKHRIKGLVADVPLYDLIQIHAYMFLTRSAQTKLVQCVRSNNSVVTDTHIVFFHQMFWDDIMMRLGRTLNFIEQLVASKLAWDCFVQCSDKSRIIEQYVGSVPEISKDVYDAMMCPES